MQLEKYKNMYFENIEGKYFKLTPINIKGE